jgi:hypothetical protein
MESTLARERIETVLRKRICSVCIEAQPDGSCGLPAQYPCALFRHLDRVINIVASTNSNSMAAYTDQMRAVICANCRLDQVSGDCGRPDDQVCPLDIYFPLVVEIVEQELAAG